MRLDEDEMSQFSEREGIQHNLGKRGAETGAGFFRLQSPFTICVPQQAPESEFMPSNNDKGVSVLLRGGRKQITPMHYNQLMQKIGADCYVSLWDEVSPTSSCKRMQTSVFRTAKWLEGTLDGVGDAAAVWGPVLGGDSEALRHLAAERLSNLNVAGYVLCGFEQVDMRHQNFPAVLQSTLTRLDADKPKLLCGNLSPEEMFTAVQMGVDLFDSSFVWELCNKGQALMSSPLENAERLEYEILEMTDPCFQEDERPVMAGCGCYCCQHHSRAYLHHLLSENEILGGTLLQMHNLSWMFEFLAQMRTNIKEEESPIQDFLQGSHKTRN